MQIIQPFTWQEAFEKFPEAIHSFHSNIMDDHDDDAFMAASRQMTREQLFASPQLAETHFGLAKAPHGIVLVTWEGDDHSTALFYDDDDGWQPIGE